MAGLVVPHTIRSIPRSIPNPIPVPPTRNNPLHSFSPPSLPADLASFTNGVDERLSSAFATVDIPVDVLQGRGGGVGAGAGPGEGKSSTSSTSHNEDNKGGECIEQQEGEEYISSSSSQNSSTGFDENDNAYYDEYDDDGMLVTTGMTASSSRSSISSLPGSVVVHPRDSMMKGRRFYDGVYEDESENVGVDDRGDGFMKFIPRVRDKRSPFRHPSSVRAMQMNDGDDESVISPPRYGKRGQQIRTPRMSEMSGMSVTSPQSAGSNRYHRSPNNQSPSKQSIKKEYPLVLLHCNLLPPSLSLPAGIRVPDPRVLKDVLPHQYWRRWKLLEDKIVGSGVVQDRGVLISHPQEAYDLLEERLLESLELVAPRLENGHFLGAHDDEDDDDDDPGDDVRSSNGAGHPGGHECPDCGTKVVKDLEGGGRKWEIKVYAANGLMRSGAWAAAWREMEKVDVEVRVWLPEDVRRDLETRVLEDDALEMEEELHESERDKRRREIYGSSVNGSQMRIDTNFGGQEYRPTGSTARLDAGYEEEIPRYTQGYEEPPTQPPQDKPKASGHSQKKPGAEVDLQTLLFNYFRILARDSRNVIIGFLGVLVLFLSVNMSGSKSGVDTPNDMIPEVNFEVIAPTPVSSVAQCAPSVASAPPVEIMEPEIEERPVYEPPVSTPDTTKACTPETNDNPPPILEDGLDESQVPVPPSEEAPGPAADEAAPIVQEEASVDEASLPLDDPDPAATSLPTEEEDEVEPPAADEVHNESRDMDEPADLPEEQAVSDMEEEIAHGSETETD
ncbi:hypothetical protein FQN54_001131 [Arachnomyces sp. PD_36]|nr:hypothetical protein FQN54_001131 [Arachnomyces sp. PD_36]